MQMLYWQTGLSQIISTIGKIRSFLTRQIALCIYKTKVSLYFDYGDIFYIDTHVRATDKLQQLQKRALRICLKSAPREPPENLHREAVIPLLSDRRLAHLRNVMFKRKGLVNFWAKALTLGPISSTR